LGGMYRNLIAGGCKAVKNHGKMRANSGFAGVEITDKVNLFQRSFLLYMKFLCKNSIT